jgi:probable F420-dependent oxidoreductase
VIQLGAVFPQMEIGADRGGVAAFAQAAQELGYRHLTAYDHVVGADREAHPGFDRPYDATDMFHEPLVLFGYLAGVAPGLELVTGVLVAPQRQTALVAKQAAEVDVLTGGRLRLGLGIGWNDVEYEALGEDFHVRGRRLDEQIELLRRLWAEPVVAFEGRFDRVTAAGIHPRPVDGGIPIWIGGTSERALRRAARLADGFLSSTGPPRYTHDRRLPEIVGSVRSWVAEAGRDPAAFGVDLRLSIADGTPDDWRAQAEQWLGHEPTHLTVNALHGGLRGPDEHVERLQAAWEALAGLW